MPDTVTDLPTHSDDQNELQELTALNPVDVRLAAMNLLARREHSRRELRQKLLKRFSDAALIDVEIDRLAVEGLQCDERFAQSYVRMRAGRGYGPARIRQEMRERGLSDAEVAAAFDAFEDDWFELALSAYEKKFGVILAAATAATHQSGVEESAGSTGRNRLGQEARQEALQAARERARRERFMQYRGFGRDHIDYCEGRGFD